MKNPLVGSRVPCGRIDEQTDMVMLTVHNFATAPKNYICFLFFEGVEFYCNVSNIKISLVGSSFDITSYDAHIAFPVVFLSLSTKQ